MTVLLAKPPGIAAPDQVTVTRDLSGGAKVVFAGKGFVLSPPDAIKFATAILGAVGIRAEFGEGGAPVIHTPRMDA